MTLEVDTSPQGIASGAAASGLIANNDILDEMALVNDLDDAMAWVLRREQERIAAKELRMRAAGAAGFFEAARRAA